MFAPKLLIKNIHQARPSEEGPYITVAALPNIAFDRVWVQGYVQKQEEDYIEISDLSAEGVWVNISHGSFSQVRNAYPFLYCTFVIHAVLVQCINPEDHVNARLTG